MELTILAGNPEPDSPTLAIARLVAHAGTPRTTTAEIDLANAVDSFSVTTGGSSAHTLAPDATPRPSLANLGAVVPTGSLYVDRQRHEDVAQIVDAWAAVHSGLLRAVVDK